MGRVSVSRLQWQAARALWESDPTITFTQIAQSLGTTRQAVQMAASRNGWIRRVDLQTLSDRAHAAADSKFETEGAASASELPAVVAGTPEKRPSQLPSSPHIRADSTEEAAHKLAHDAAIERRAEVLSTHRKEWLAVRTLAYASIKSRDMDAAKHMKVIAESLKIVQEGERKAWGLDADEKKPPAVTVTINRRAGVTIGH